MKRTQKDRCLHIDKMSPTVDELIVIPVKMSIAEGKYFAMLDKLI
jgi:hypothetical protein